MTDRHQAILIAHGAFVLLLGLLTGYIYIFSLIGEVNLWPIPGSLAVEMPSNPDRWRAAHVGNILNALMAIGVALALPKLRLSAGREKFVTWGMILTIWGNAGFYILSGLGASGRGLTFGANKFGGGDLLSTLTFLVAYPGAIIAPIVVVLVALGALAASREASSGVPKAPVRAAGETRAAG